MQVRYVDANPAEHTTPLLGVGVFQGTAELGDGPAAELDEALGGLISRALERGDMKGRSEEELLFYPTGGAPERVLVLGLGKAEELEGETVRRAGARLVRAAERLGLESGALSLAGFETLDPETVAQAAAEGGALAAWRFTELKARDEERPFTSVRAMDLVASRKDDAFGRGTLAGAAIARGENLARTLQSRPGNIATPSHVAAEAVRIGGSVGMSVEVFDEARMAEEGMHAILAVSRGSDEEARLIVMRHDGGEEGDPPLVLVGKGLTFDTGGISLKPSANMEDMKFDMSGGAAVIGAMQAIAELGVRANVVGIVPSSENMPSGAAVKPGDVIRTLAGKTVEVINTDAEGRLILADALAYGSRLEPAAMVDCATLTGSVVVALGHHAAAVLGNDDALVGELVEAGTRSGERCWHLPLWDEYRKQLESETADLKNVGGRPGGTITAGSFLEEFVGEATWAHLDIAGTAYGDGNLPYRRKGGYGFPTRLLVAWVRSRSG
ncbi:MAG: leucyl aminopeptidase [Gemmatimonadota bacterium]|nr:leucyl aminopeptidase [Gemmatimonadota bacterium]